MQLILEGLSKKYPKNKLFENLNYTFETNNTYAITGENGSGKSTFIKIIAGVLAPSKGKVTFSEKGKTIEKDKIYQLLGIVAPYLNLIEEYTLKEHLDFHDLRFLFIVNLIEFQGMLISHSLYSIFCSFNLILRCTFFKQLF
jgi:ABC-type multidrug transport system ATPase subunit